MRIKLEILRDEQDDIDDIRWGVFNNIIEQLNNLINELKLEVNKND